MTNLACTFAAVLIGTTMAMGGQFTPRESAIARAKEKVVQDRRLPADQVDRVETVDAVEVEWRDASLGCPQPGMMYAQVITPGYRVTLRWRGEPVIVHATADRAVICEKPVTTPGPAVDGKPSASDTVAGLKLAESARTDLARRLRVEPAQVTITRYRVTTWPDAHLGCPVKDRGNTPVTPQLTRGFIIELASNGRSYEYHSDMTRVVACDAGSAR